MSNQIDQERLKQAMTSFCMSRAILEDYAKTIARIEGRDEQEVLHRVRVRTREIMKEVQSNLINSSVAEPPIHTSVNSKPSVRKEELKQPELFSASSGYSTKSEKLSMPDGEVIVFPEYFSKQQSDYYFQLLLSNISWRQDKIKYYGKEMPLPRLTAWYGETDKPYTYSGIPMAPDAWTSELLKIKTEIEKVAGVSFSSVLLNLYRDGRDSVSWHSDDEKELGENPTIASISFGDTRVFQFKHKYLKDLPKIDVPLTHGSLVIMKGKTQHYWQHQIPKTAKELKERINLTFRVIK